MNCGGPCKEENAAKVCHARPAAGDESIDICDSCDRGSIKAPQACAVYSIGSAKIEPSAGNGETRRIRTRGAGVQVLHSRGSCSVVFPEFDSRSAVCCRKV